MFNGSATTLYICNLLDSSVTKYWIFHKKHESFDLSSRANMYVAILVNNIAKKQIDVLPCYKYTTITKKCNRVYKYSLVD